jgi:NAD(P)-dependent dehydrogenase (short-subunit alcohol dehydrogenase family)
MMQPDAGQRATVQSWGNLAGKVVLITGASKGIGRGLAVGLGKCGATVVGSYKNDATGAEETVAEIRKYGAEAHALQADVGSSADARRMVDECVQRFGQIHALVNNAGRTRFGPPEDVGDEDWDDVMDTNVRGTFVTSLAAAAHMKRLGGGAIVNITSCAASLGLMYHSVYSTSKGAIETMTRQLALELAPHVRVNAIAPAPTSTARNREYDPGYDEKWGRVIPLGRVGQPEDLVGPVCFLISDQSRFLTGEVLHVDGGWTLRGVAPDMADYNFNTDRERG